MHIFDRFWETRFNTLMSHIVYGQLHCKFPDHSERIYKGTQPGPRAVLEIHNIRALSRIFLRGHLGFCEAYLDGDWDSPDLTALFSFALKNAEYYKKTFLGKPWAMAISRLWHLVHPNSKSGSRKNIHAHYDLGNAFYGEWLGPSMTYSSGLFQNGANSMEAAHTAKYDAMLDRLNVDHQHHILEIGCGWGGFAEHAARKTGCKITAITLSKEQYEYTKARMQKANLESLVHVQLKDYRDLEGTYDRIASIEMFEAVGEPYWPVFFETLRQRLKAGGRAVIQTITIDENEFPIYRRSVDYIQRYVFPGGMLPSIPALKGEAMKAGLRPVSMLAFGKDYARTLNEWNESFQAKWDQITKQDQKFDMRFKRLWEQYLCYCEAGFSTGPLDVIQIAIDKPAA